MTCGENANHTKFLVVKVLRSFGGKRKGRLTAPTPHCQIRGWCLQGRPKCGVLLWSPQHKFRSNHLIVSVPLERISIHAELLWVPDVSRSLPSLFLCCRLRPLFTPLFFNCYSFHLFRFVSTQSSHCLSAEVLPF